MTGQPEKQLIGMTYLPFESNIFVKLKLVIKEKVILRTRGILFQESMLQAYIRSEGTLKLVRTHPSIYP